MINRELILKKVCKIEDKLFISKIIDKAVRTQQRKEVTYSDFLDPYQKMLLERVLSGGSNINYWFNGGYSGAERVVIIFRPDFISCDEISLNNQMFCILNIKVLSRESLTHRDYLGALMSLGIKREKIGDILVREDSGSIIVLSEFGEYIKYNLVKIGNAKIEINTVNMENLETQEPKMKEFNTTVASMRLDTVASSGFGTSRTKMAEYIKSDRVSLNWEVTNDIAKNVKEGDTISIRGKGRLEVDSIGRLTRKGRTSLVLKKYI